MARTAARVGVLLLLTIPLAGCLGGDDGVPDHFVANGSSPIVMRSIVYDGVGATATTGTITIDVTESTGTGSVEARVTADGTPWVVTWNQFIGNPANPFQKQGISHDFQEHGASGQGDSNWPEMHLVSAGWGPASVTRAGAAVPDPLTGSATMTAHYMVTDTGVFDDATKRMLTTDGSGVFNPLDAGNGMAVDGDREIHLIVRSDAAAVRHDDTDFTESGATSPTAPTGSSQFQVMGTPARATVTVTVGPPSDGLPVVPAQVNVTLVDPANTVLRAAQLGGQGQTRSITWEFESLPTVGTYVVLLNTEVGAADWTVTGNVDHPDPFTLYMVFEDADW